MARTKFQLTGPAVQRGGNTVRQLVGLSYVYVAVGDVNPDGTPKSDGDRETYVFANETGGYGYYVLTSSLSTVTSTPKVGDRVKLIRSGRSNFTSRAVGQEGVVKAVPSRAEGLYVIGEIIPATGGPSSPLTQYGYAEDLEVVAASPVEAKASDFPTGRLVLVGATPTTGGGGWVAPEFANAVGRVKSHTDYDENVRVELLDGSEYNVISASHLTLLPEGVDLASKVARPELAFEDAIRKAAAHRDAVEGKSATDALIELAKLLVEVAK